MKESFCPYYNQHICQSCQWIEKTYDQQLNEKSEYLILLLGESTRKQLLPPVRSSEKAFRNKAKFSVTGTLDHPVIGLVGEKDLDQGREILNCPIHHPKINDVANLLPAFIQKAQLHPYQIKNRSGELKGVILYYSAESNEMYVRFILRSKESIDRIRKYLPETIKALPFLTCVSANIQPVPHALLDGDEEIFFTAKNFISHQLGPVRMGLHPQGFVQTNQQVATKLYLTATQWIKELNIKKFLELFSGQGAFSFFIQSEVEEALGIEINQEAVKRANATAESMGIHHLKFIASDATKIKKDVLHFGPDIVLVNPPRRGMGESVHLIRELKPPHLIYSSCEARTLADDIKLLAEDYQIQKLQVFDMFPHTSHFETLVHLKLIEADKKLSSY